MEGGNIQLLFGHVRNDSKNEDLPFNLPLNFGKDIRFDKLPYISHLQNPAIDNVLKGGKVDDIALQKYLLTTGLLQDTIQENLNMVITNGDFNNRSISRELDTKYPSVMKKNQILLMLFLKVKLDLTCKTPR